MLACAAARTGLPAAGCSRHACTPAHPGGAHLQQLHLARAQRLRRHAGGLCHQAAVGDLGAHRRQLAHRPQRCVEQGWEARSRVQQVRMAACGGPGVRAVAGASGRRSSRRLGCSSAAERWCHPSCRILAQGRRQRPSRRPAQQAGAPEARKACRRAGVCASAGTRSGRATASCRTAASAPSSTSSPRRTSGCRCTSCARQPCEGGVGTGTRAGQEAAGGGRGGAGLGSVEGTASAPLHLPGRLQQACPALIPAAAAASQALRTCRAAHRGPSRAASHVGSDREVAAAG